SAPRQTEGKRCGDVPNFHVMIERAVENSDGHVREVQRAAAESSNLEVFHDRRGMLRHRFLVWTAKAEHALRVRRIVFHAGSAGAIPQAKTRSAVNQDAPTQVINDTVNR